MPAPLIESPPPPPGSRVTVSREELERAFCVWLRTMPRHLWQPYLDMLAVDPKRRTEADRAGPKMILAAYLVGRFERAHWDTSYVQPERSVGWPSGSMDRYWGEHRCSEAATQRVCDRLAPVMDGKVYDEPSDVVAEAGVVVVDGPDGVAVTLTPTSASETGKRLQAGAEEAERQAQER